MDKINISKLANGINVCSNTNLNSQTISLVIQVRSGGLTENSENFGISHFLEHMAYKGTKTLSALEIAKTFDEFGDNFNAYTSKTKTVYYVKVLPENFKPAIDLMADILLNSTFTQEEIERERNVILQEIAQAEDTPDDIIFDNFFSAAYGSSPLGSPILGNKEFIKKLDRQTLIEYMKQKYTAPNFTIAAAGAIKHEDLLKYTQETFGIMENNSKYQPNPFPNSRYRNSHSIKNQDLEQVHVLFGYEGVSHHSKDYYIQQVVTVMLGGGMSSRLFQAVREQRGLAYTVNTYSNNFHDTGLFSIYSCTEEKNLYELIQVVKDEIHSLTTSISSEELERTKKMIRTNMIMGLENTISQAERLANNVMFFNRYIPKEEVFTALEEISEKDIINYIEKFILKKSPTFACIGRRLDESKLLKVFNN